MHRNVLVLLLMLGLAPVAVLAQDQQPAPPAPPAPIATPATVMAPAQHRQAFAAFRRFHQQAERIQRATRARILALLTVGHRALLAHVVGNLAISPNPNPRAAAQELDASLNASEKAAILAAAHTEMTQMRALGDQMRTQMQSIMPAPSGGQPNHIWVRRGARRHHAPDAGEILLRTVALGEAHPPMMFVRMGHGAPPPPPQQP